MSLPVDTGIIWVAVAILYLAAQPVWDHLAAWAARWRGRPARWVKGLRRRRVARPLTLVGRVIYSLAIPYACLLLGVADARRLGLAGLAWWPQLPLGAAVGLAGVAYLTWSWGRMAAVTFRRVGHRQLLAAEAQAFATPWGWAGPALEVLCLEGSWAFVRGAAIWLLGLYPGVFLGLAAVAAGWFLRPGSPVVLEDPDLRARGLLTASLAVLSALVFLCSENLWLAALVHGLGLVGAALAARRAYAGDA